MDIHYVGFWARLFAFIIDNILILLFCGALIFILMMPFPLGNNSRLVVALRLIIEYIVPIIIIVLFWIYREATPGKMLIGAKIVDAKTLAKPSSGQYIGRYFAYYVSTIFLFLGFIWIAFDQRKQGWHDKLAHTVVIYRK